MKLFLTILFFSSFFYSQAQLQIGYNFIRHNTFPQSVSVLKYDFQKDVDEVTQEHFFSPVFRGITFGCDLPLTEIFRVDFDLKYRIQKSTAKGTRTPSRRFPDANKYQQIRYAHNTFAMTMLLGPESISGGYGIEIGRFKRWDRTEEGGKWNKKVRNKNITISLTLNARFKIGEEESSGLIIAPYWKISNQIFNQHDRRLIYNEFFKLNGLGLSIGYLFVFND